ncbi:MAG: N-acetylmuramoyl-L-alanine amidase family protein [Clostridiales bacterium]
MKKNFLRYFAFLQVIILIFMFMSGIVFAETSKIDIEVDGKLLKTDIDPVIVNGRTLIPTRALFEDLGGIVNWNNETREVIIQYKNNKIILKINSKIAIVNNKEIDMDVPASILSSRTVIPLRFVAENFGIFVEWNDKERLVSLDTKTKGRLESYEFVKGAQTDILSIKASLYESYDTTLQKDPNGIIINLKGTKVVEKVKTKERIIKDSNYVSNVEFLQIDNDTAQIKIETREMQNIKVDKKSDGLIVYVEKYSVIGSVKYNVDNNSRTLTLNDIWLYNTAKSSDSKLYNIEKSNDDKQITLSFDQSLGNNLKDVSIDPNDNLVSKINVINDSSKKIIKIVIISSNKVELLDNSESESKNTKFIIKEIEKDDGYLKINCTKSNGNSYVKIYGGDYSKYEHFRLTGPERIVIDIPNAKVKDNYNEYIVNNEMISKIRYSQYEKNKARVVIDTLKQYEYFIEFKDGIINVEIHNPSFKNIKYYNSDGRKFVISGVKLVEGSNCQTTYNSDLKYFTLTFSNTLGSYGTGWLKIFDNRVDYLRVEEKNGKNVISIKASEDFKFYITPNNDNSTTLNLGVNNVSVPPIPPIPSGKLVVIDAGHGGDEPGAVSNGVYEKDLNLDIALRLEKLLKASGVSTKMTRTTDISVGLYERSDMANDLDAALFVSIHHNAYYESSHGTETLYNKNKGDYGVGFTGYSFANIVQNNLVENLKLTNRGIVNRPDLAVLRRSNMPSILAEIGFISNKSEREKLLQNSVKQSAAQALADSIIEALSKIN